MILVHATVKWFCVCLNRVEIGHMQGAFDHVSFSYLISGFELFSFDWDSSKVVSEIRQ